MTPNLYDFILTFAEKRGNILKKIWKSKKYFVSLQSKWKNAVKSARPDKE